MTNSLTIQYIIVDDSKQARKLLNLMIQEHHKNLICIGEAENVEQAAILIKELRPQLVFLDIEMPEKSGLQLVEEISRDDINYEIIFTTAFNEYALNAFRLSAIDYLLKPIDEEQLEQAIEKVKQKIEWQSTRLNLEILKKNFQKEGEETLRITDTDGYQFIQVMKIIYVEADGSYTKIYTTDNKTILVSKNLKHIEFLLSGIPYIHRVHRSFIVNLHHIKRFDKSDRGKIIMKNDTSIDLSREKRNSFLEAITNFL
jgi:two-component system LytT family response regulator